MNLHEIFSIGPQWANQYEVTRNLTQPHLPSFVMTYHDLATQLNQIFISQPNLDWSPRNFHHRPTVAKQIWSDPKPDLTSPTLICHDLSWPTHPIKTNTYKSAKSICIFFSQVQVWSKSTIIKHKACTQYPTSGQFLTNLLGFVLIRLPWS